MCSTELGTEVGGHGLVDEISRVKVDIAPRIVRCDSGVPVGGRESKRRGISGCASQVLIIVADITLRANILIVEALGVGYRA